MTFNKFCNERASNELPEDDKKYSADMKKKAKRDRYKDPEHEKKRGAYMKNIMKDKIHHSAKKND